MHSSRQLSLNPTQNHQQKTTLLTPLITTTALCKGGGKGGGLGGGRRGGSDNRFVQRGREGGGKSDMTKRFVQGWRVGRVGINQTTAVCVGWGDQKTAVCGVGERSDVTTALYRGGCIQHRTSKGIPCMKTHHYHNLVSKP